MTDTLPKTRAAWPRFVNEYNAAQEREIFATEGSDKSEARFEQFLALQSLKDAYDRDKPGEGALHKKRWRDIRTELFGGPRSVCASSGE